MPRPPGLAHDLVVVLDSRDLARDRILRALEIDDAVLLARAAAFVAHGNVAVEVSPRMFLAHFDKRTLGLDLRKIGKIHRRHETSARAGSFIFFYRHRI